MTKQPIETAPKDGTWIWAYWPADPHAVAYNQTPMEGPACWKSPGRGVVPHWCLDGEWTPGLDPTHWRAINAETQKEPAGSEWNQRAEGE